MGYKVDYGALRSLVGAYNGAVSQWNSGVSSVMGQASAIVASTNIAGNSADRVKAYLDTAYSCVNASLSMLLGLFQQNFLLYTDAYTQQVDAAGDTHIEEEELSELYSSLETQRGKAQQIALAAETAIQGISDLVLLPGPDFNGADTGFGSILTSLDDLNSAVNGVESAHVSSDFSQIDALISNLDAHLIELLGQSKEFKTAFSAANYAALASVPALLQATDDAYNQLLAQEPAVTAAAGRLEAQLALEQAEVEKRQQQAKWFKIGVYAAVAIGSAVVIAACPAASPVVIGMASGLITSTVSASADEYVKHGFNFGEWDKGRIGAHACIGTVTGMIGGAVGSEAGIFAKATVKGISGALEGAATTSYDQLATYGKITDTKAILVDAAVKGGSSFAGSLIGGAIAKNTKSIGISSLDKAMDDPLSKAHGLSVFLFEGGKSLGTGVVSRGVSSLTGQAITLSADGTPVQLSELDLASVSEDMFSPESMGKDFVVSGAAGAAGDYVELRTPDPDTGLTPIIQYKLGNTTDPDTGLTPIVQDSLSHIVDEDELSDILGKMEERNPSTGSASVIDEPKYAASFDQQGENTSRTDWQSIDWENTSSTPEEIKILEEMEQNGEIEIHRVNPNLAEPERGKPHLPSESGVFSGERGNSAFTPYDQKVVDHMREYGQDYVEYRNNEVDFSPFTKHDSPWGLLDCEVEIGHMTDQRQNPSWEYGRRPAGAGHDPNYDLGNFAQADNALLDRIRETNPNATMDDVSDFIESNHLTWHECADGKTMQLVPTDIHDASRHSGGVSEMKYRMAMGNVELSDE